MHKNPPKELKLSSEISEVCKTCGFITRHSTHIFHYQLQALMGWGAYVCTTCLQMYFFSAPLCLLQETGY